MTHLLRSYASYVHGSPQFAGGFDGAKVQWREKERELKNKVGHPPAAAREIYRSKASTYIGMAVGAEVHKHQMESWNVMAGVYVPVQRVTIQT